MSYSKTKIINQTQLCILYSPGQSVSLSLSLTHSLFTANLTFYERRRCYAFRFHSVILSFKSCVSKTVVHFFLSLVALSYCIDTFEMRFKCNPHYVPAFIATLKLHKIKRTLCDFLWVKCEGLLTEKSREKGLICSTPNLKGKNAHFSIAALNVKNM